jgi:outer membrane lipoprotein-sorting protein
VIARRLLSSVAVALLLGACASARPAPDAVPDEARRLAALLTERWRAFTDLRTAADVTLRRGGSTNRFSGVLLAKSPDSLRFEALTPFGIPLFVLGVSDETLTAYLVPQSRAFVGRVNGDTTGKYLGTSVEADELVALLVGRPIPPRGVKRAEILPADAVGRSLLMEGAGQTRRYWMDFQTGEVQKLEVSGGRVSLVVTYERERGQDLPIAVRATTSEMDMDAHLRFRSPAVGSGVDPARFTIALPEGVRVHRFR